MNKRLIVLALSLCLPIAALAEAGHEMESPAMCKMRTEHLAKELGLNDEQKTKVEAIFAAQKEKIKALHEETDASIKAILTPEQQTKFDALQAQRKQMRQERMKEHLGKKPAGIAPAASPAH
jgi:periplasmic protein CpxP/Spy